MLSANKTPRKSTLLDWSKWAEAYMCVPRTVEDFKAIQKKTGNSSQAFNSFMKLAPVLNFEEIMHSILIFSYQKAYQKESL